MENKQLFLIVAIAFITALVVSMGFNATTGNMASDYKNRGYLILKSSDIGGKTLDVDGEVSFNVGGFYCSIKSLPISCSVTINGENYSANLNTRAALIGGTYSFMIQSVSGYPANEAVRIMFYKNP